MSVTMTGFTSDLRRTRRASCRVRLVGAVQTALSGEVKDLSPTGLCLATSTHLEKGRQLNLEFTLGSGAVDAVGEVRWARAGEVGIRFVRISSAAQAAILEATREVPAESRWMRRHQFVQLG